MPYANRVRRLVFDERSAKYRTKVIDNMAFFDISGTKLDPLGAVLPNLQSLVWHVYNSDSQFKAITFMHDTVREFDVLIHPKARTDLSATDWEAECERLRQYLADRSAMNLPYRVRYVL